MVAESIYEIAKRLTTVAFDAPWLVEIPPLNFVLPCKTDLTDVGTACINMNHWMLCVDGLDHGFEDKPLEFRVQAFR